MMRLGLLPKLPLPHAKPLNVTIASFRPHAVKPQSAKLSSRLHARQPSLTRLFTYTHRFRQNDRPEEPQTRGQVQHKPEPSDSLRPETIQKPEDADVPTKMAPKTEMLLSEQTVSNKEQRKADWAILKEMTKYLWPQVREDVAVVFPDQF